MWLTYFGTGSAGHQVDELLAKGFGFSFVCKLNSCWRWGNVFGVKWMALWQDMPILTDSSHDWGFVQDRKCQDRKCESI